MKEKVLKAITILLGATFIAATIVLVVFGIQMKRQETAWNKEHTVTVTVKLLERTNKGFIAETDDGERIRLDSDKFDGELDLAITGDVFQYEEISGEMGDTPETQRFKTAVIIFFVVLGVAVADVGLLFKFNL